MTYEIRIPAIIKLLLMIQIQLVAEGANMSKFKHLLKGRTGFQIQVNAKTRKIYEKVHQAASVDLWLTRGSNTSQQRQLHYQGKTSPVGRPLCLITFITFYCIAFVL